MKMTEETLHKPTLESIEMVEETIKTLSNRLTRYQLWKKLPRKMMYQTYTLILKYLEKSGKISINEGKKLVWIAKPVLENIFKPILSKKTMEKPASDLSPEIEKILESLNPDERAILGFLEEKTIQAIEKKTNLDQTRVLRALQFLSNKGIVKVKFQLKKIIDLGDNGVVYLKNGLPERRLLDLLVEKQSIELKDSGKEAKLSENELKAALGALKGKAMISLKQGKIMLEAKKEEIIQKSLEEQFIESLPLILEQLKPEQKLAYENLKDRKDILKIEDEKNTEIELTDIGKKIYSVNLDDYKNLIESLTSDMIKEESWKGKKFRRYDITSPVPSIYGGRTHPFLKVADLVRKTFLEMGFKEMTGPWVETAFWNMDSMWIPQDHPAREAQDTFYLPYSGNIPKKLAEKIALMHKSGGNTGSKGYGYKWNPELAKQILLRTHTTAVTYRTFSKGIKPPAKYFCIGRIFRNETVNPTHLPEFHQVEGFIMDEGLTLKDLMGYIKEFYKRMGITKIKFKPTYNPYTEPSMEALGYSEERKEWVELINSGIFRPEALEPYGIKVPVIAWGLGLERLAMLIYKKKTIKELLGATCDLNWLRSYKIPKLKW